MDHVRYDETGNQFRCYSPGLPLRIATFTEDKYSMKNYSDAGEEVDRRTQEHMKAFGEDYESSMNKILNADPELKEAYAEITDEIDFESTDFSHGAGSELNERIRQYCLDHNLNFIESYDEVMDRILSADTALLRAYSEEG